MAIDNVSALGVEPNIEKQESAKRKGVDVTNFDLKKHNEQYDVISFLNVFSHLPNPPKNISEWKHLLKPGGILFMQTGDAADIDSKTIYKPLDLPDHLSFGSEKIVTNILEKLNFKVLKIKKYPLEKPGIVSFIKELIKSIIPGKKSKIKCFYTYRKHPNTDMFIKAVLNE